MLLKCIFKWFPISSKFGNPVIPAGNLSSACIPPIALTSVSVRTLSSQHLAKSSHETEILHTHASKQILGILI